MCLLGIAFGLFDDFPLLVLANREEFYSRPSAGPQIFARNSQSPAWLGGIDLVAGGTWLGVNESGLLVAITNRHKAVQPPLPPSRGQLCRGLLAQREPTGAVKAALAALGDGQYAGCNLLIASREEAFVVEAGDELKSTRLTSGLHLLANATLDDPADLRIARVRHEFEHSRPTTVDAWFDTSRRICTLTGESLMPPICLTGTDRGTVSSTVLGLGRNLDASRYWYAPGIPSMTQYDDHTPLLGELFRIGQPGSDTLTNQARQAGPEVSHLNPVGLNIEPPDNSPARRAARQSHVDGPTALAVPEQPVNSPYRIFLRGPWQSEPQARAERTAAGSLTWSAKPLPEAETVKLPAPWQELFGEFRGRVTFRRKFHPPSNLGPATRLAIAFDGIGGSGSVSLNGQLLGRIGPGPGPHRFDVSGRMQVNCQLQVELEFTEWDGSAPGGLYAPVALEIVEAG